MTREFEIEKSSQEGIDIQSSSTEQDFDSAQTSLSLEANSEDSQIESNGFSQTSDTVEDTVSFGSESEESFPAVKIVDSASETSEKPEEVVSNQQNDEVNSTYIEVSAETDSSSELKVESKSATNVNEVETVNEVSSTPDEEVADRPIKFDSLLKTEPVVDTQNAEALASEKFITKPEFELFSTNKITREELLKLNTRTLIAESLGLSSSDELNRARFNTEIPGGFVLPSNVLSTGVANPAGQSDAITEEDIASDRAIVAKPTTSPVQPLENDLDRSESSGSEKVEPVAFASMKVVRSNDVVTSNDSNSVEEISTASKDRDIIPAMNVEDAREIELVETKPALFGALIESAPVAGSQEATSINTDGFITKEESRIFAERGETKESIRRLDSRTLMASDLGMISTVELNSATINTPIDGENVVETGELKMVRDRRSYEAPEVRMVKVERSDVRSGDEAPAAPVSFNDLKVVRATEVVTSSESETQSDAPATKPALFGDLIESAPVAGSQEATSINTEGFITKEESRIFAERGETKESIRRLDSRSLMANDLGLSSTVELNSATINTPVVGENVVETGELKMVRDHRSYEAPEVRMVKVERTDVRPGEQAPTVPTSFNDLKVVRAADVVTTTDSDTPSEAPETKPALFGGLIESAPVAGSKEATSINTEGFITKEESRVFAERGETLDSMSRLDSRSLMANDLGLSSTVELNSATINTPVNGESVVATGEFNMVRDHRSYEAPEVRMVKVETPEVRTGDLAPTAPTSFNDLKVVRAADVVTTTDSDTPSEAPETKPALFGGLIESAPVAGSKEATAINSELFITKEESRVFAERGETLDSMRRLDSRSLMANDLGLSSTVELNSATINTPVNGENVVATGEFNMVRDHRSYEAPEVRMVKVERTDVRPGEQAPTVPTSFNDLKVVRTGEVITSTESETPIETDQTRPVLFGGLIDKAPTAGSEVATSINSEGFITKEESRVFAERGETLDSMRRLDSRTLMANDLGMASTVALNSSSINTVTGSANVVSTGEIQMVRDHREYVTPEVRLVKADSNTEPVLPVVREVVDFDSIEVVKTANLVVSSNHKQSVDAQPEERGLKIDLDNDQIHINSSLNRVAPANDDSVVVSSNLKAPLTVSVEPTVSVANDVDLTSISKSNQGYTSQPIATTRFANSMNVQPASLLMRQSNSHDLNVISKAGSEVANSASSSRSLLDNAVATSSSNSISKASRVRGFDYSSVKRVAETVMPYDSAKSVSSYQAAKSLVNLNGNLASTSTNSRIIEGPLSTSIIDITNSQTKVSQTAGRLHTIQGSIFDSLQNTNSSKVSTTVKAMSITSSQIDSVSFDTTKALIGTVSKFDSVKHVSADRVSGNLISISSKADASTAIGKVDCKVINLNIDGLVNITKFDPTNLTGKTLSTQNVTLIPTAANTTKVDANNTIKADINVSQTGTKSDTTNTVKSVDAVIQTAKSFVNTSTAPAIIAAIKNGEPLPEGMVYENGFVKLTHNGQVLYFPGLEAALKFVEGISGKGVSEDDDEEWYVEKLDAQGNSSRVQYVVVPGDTIESICSQRLGDARYAELLITINRSEIVYRELNGQKVPFVYPGQVIMLPSRYECKVFRKNFFASNQSSEISSTSANSSGLDSKYNAPASSPEKLLAKLHKEVVEHYDPNSRDNESSAVTQEPVSAPLGITIERVRFAGGKESVELKEYKQSVGQLSQSKFHEVKEGDTLLTIALNEKSLGDTRFWKLIAKVNGLTTRLDAFGIPCETLVPGQHLLIPDRKQVIEFCLQESIPTPKSDSCPISEIQFAPSDTVVTSEVEVKAYSKDCRATLTGSPVNRSDFTINLQLKVDSAWITVTTYQARNGKTVRSTYTKDGVNSTIVIDLPEAIVKQMAYEEFERSWKLRCGMYKIGAKSNTRNKVVRGPKPVLAP